MAITWECYKKPFKDQWIRVLKAETNQQISDTTIPGLYMRYSATTGHQNNDQAPQSPNTTISIKKKFINYFDTPPPPK